MKEQTIAGLDIGSSNIRMVVGQEYLDGNEHKLQILGAAEMPAEGIHRGSITSADTAVQAITACIEKLERMSGVPIESATVGITGTHIVPQTSRGVVAVGKVNGEILKADLERAIEAARAIATPANYEILHVIPRHSIIDGQISIKDPLGMTGTRLEVDTLIIQGFSSEIRNFTKCIYRTGLEIDDLVFSLLATAEGVLTHKQRELGCALLNIGASTTSIIVYEEGEVIHAVVLPYGSDHITNDIAIGLRIPLEVAEKIKCDYGKLIGKEVNKKLDIDLAEIDEHEQGMVSMKMISQIVDARVEEIFDKIELEFKKIGRSGMLPAGVILTGGGSRLHGIIESAKKFLKLPTSFAQQKTVLNPIEALFDQGYTTATSLALWGLSAHAKSAQHNAFFFGLENSIDVPGRVKKWFKALLP
ncbi:cell division protein FtsA [Candidatus Uhrbacteria bacterium]|nr:cell division protein FtsA [Candidatus Uhrbacteria bacterium]